MAVTALIGLQWGDEGKGKVVDTLSDRMEIVVRAQGGANAGHTVKVGAATHVLHLIPSGMLYPHVTGVIGNGVVVDPFQLFSEIDELARAGCDVSGRLLVSERAHLVLQFHKEMDRVLEEMRGSQALGTTGRGIGPAYMDKAARVGLRVGDLRDSVACRRLIVDAVEAKNRVLAAHGSAELDGALMAEELLAARERLLSHVTDTVGYLNNAAAEGREILIEGAQGALLDIDLGTYPFVTSSSCHVGGLLAGSGLPPRSLGRVIGVAKAYCTRVGSGPFPTEESSDIGERLRAHGREFGATTGRPRRCGWFDAVAARYAIRTNGVDELALTKSDILAGEPVIRICTGYRVGGAEIREFPAGAALDRAEPLYQEFEGFDGDLSGATSFESLPSTLRKMIDFLEEICDARVGFISTGPERHQYIRR